LPEVGLAKVLRGEADIAAALWFALAHRPHIEKIPEKMVNPNCATHARLRGRAGTAAEIFVFTVT
jgi:hypothetical protein